MHISSDDMHSAFDEWGANCGPSAISAVCNVPLAAVRPHMGDFEKKRYTNPTLMWDALISMGVLFNYRGGDLGKNNWPRYGLARIQWEGPWTMPNVPIRARYRHTHWIGVDATGANSIGIFDCNATANGSGWTSLQDWQDGIVPWILSECVPRASGGWHITHSVDVTLP